MTIGPRVWKTGLAVVISLLICEEFNLPSPIFAVIAAIVTMRPSVAQSFTEGGNRIAATLIGGIIGFAFLYFFGSTPYTIGFAIVLAILICNQLKLERAIILTGISVAAVMVDVQGDPFEFASVRLLVTILGIIVGLLVNLLFFPPKSEDNLKMGIKKLNFMLKGFYIHIVNGFLESSNYNHQEIEKMIECLRLEYEEVRKKLFEFKKEQGYFFESDKVKLYEKIVSDFYLVFERIIGIYNTEKNRIERNINLKEVTQEYQKILDVCRQLLLVTVNIQDSLNSYYSSDMQEFVSTCSSQSDDLIKKLREMISQWHLVERNHGKSTSLLEIANIGYEMEQIYHFLNSVKESFEKIKELEKKNSQKKNKRTFKKAKDTR